MFVIPFRASVDIRGARHIYPLEHFLHFRNSPAGVFASEKLAHFFEIPELHICLCWKGRETFILICSLSSLPIPLFSFPARLLRFFHSIFPFLHFDALYFSLFPSGISSLVALHLVIPWNYVFSSLHFTLLEASLTSFIFSLWRWSLDNYLFYFPLRVLSSVHKKRYRRFLGFHFHLKCLSLLWALNCTNSFFIRLFFEACYFFSLCTMRPYYCALIHIIYRAVLTYLYWSNSLFPQIIARLRIWNEVVLRL